MMNDRKVSIIIPCKNEAKALQSLIPKIPKFIDEVIVVDNGSTDRTAKVAKKLGAIVIKENRTVDGIGYGYAHQTGLKKATGDYIVVMDGDDTYPVQSIRKILKVMEDKGYDFISCNRLPLHNQKAINPIRRLGIHVLNLETLLLFGNPIKDILTGMWIMNRHAANRIKAKSGGWDYSPEIKIEAITNPYIRFSEYHIRHFFRAKGVSKLKIWKSGFGHLCFIAKMRWEGMGAVRVALENLFRPIIMGIKLSTTYLLMAFFATFLSRSK